MKRDLEIILITYNRKEHLQNTFNQIFADNSPIKNMPITILDNKSTDGSSELIQEYCKICHNIKHIIHNRNIGGNANIARAFELAKQKYVWILCDDDEYDWSHWQEVEQAMAEDYDAIVVANYVNPYKNIAQLVKQLTFVPAGIYKTENITSTVMVNAEFNLSNMFAQLAIVCNLINEQKRICICENWIVKMVPNGCEETYVRGLDDNKHPLMAEMLWPVGFVNSMQMIKDKKIKKFILNNTKINDDNWYSNYISFLKSNKRLANNSLRNLCNLFCGLNIKQKILFLFCLIFFNLTYYLFFVELEHDKVHLLILGRLKTYIRFKPKREDGASC